MVVTVYRPPQGNCKKGCEFLNLAFERANLKDNTDVFLMGDFNINFGDRNTPEYKELSFTTQALGLKQFITEPTRYGLRNGVQTETILDLIFSNSEILSDSVVMDMNISDHQAVRIRRKKIHIKHDKVEFRGRSYRNYNKDEFQRLLREENWDMLFTLDDPDKQWEFMYGTIVDLIDVMCPTKSFKVNAKKEPWITNEALEAIRDKDLALKKAKRTGRQEDWVMAKRLRNSTGRDLKNLRADFLKAQQEENADDPNKFWKVVSSIVPNQKSTDSKIWLKNTETGCLIDPVNTAEYINKFFTEVGPNLAKAHNLNWEYFGDTLQISADPIHTTVEEVSKLCKEIIPMKSSGLDKLSSRICRDAFMVLSTQLTYIFNTSLGLSRFPDAWKKAKVVPLFKGGDRENVSNYRPVSLLPLPGKLLEKIVHSRITSFWDDNNFLSENQGGFRKGHSTISTIADLTDELFCQINQGNTTLAAFIDLRKAFDTVNLNILINKLERAGIRGGLLLWCKSYLAGRTQCTIANGVVSDPKSITCGVPQGSVLGPLFFLVYVNDLQGTLNECGLKLYADDTVLYQSGLNWQEAANKLQPSLDQFMHWSAVNQLTLNVNKTKLMVFGSRNKVKKAKHAVVRANGQALQLVPSFKYLGILLDSTLTFNLHIASVLRTILHKLYFLGKLKRYLRDDTAICIYKSMLLPYFDYADVIYNNACSKDLHKLQTLQNKSLRLCLGRDRMFSTDRAHKLANVPFLKDRRRAHILNFMFKTKSNNRLLNVREIRTRAHDAPLFNVKIPRCESFKRSVGYFGSTMWNDLTAAIRNTASYLVFRNARKVEMLRPLALIE